MVAGLDVRTCRSGIQWFVLFDVPSAKAGTLRWIALKASSQLSTCFLLLSHSAASALKRVLFAS